MVHVVWFVTYAMINPMWRHLGQRVCAVVRSLGSISGYCLTIGEMLQALTTRHAQWVAFRTMCSMPEND